MLEKRALGILPGTSGGADHESRYQEGKDGRKLYRKMSDGDSFKEKEDRSLCEKND